MLCPSECQRRETGLFAEETAEVRGVLKMQVSGYFLDGLPGMRQAELDVLRQLLVDELLGRFSIDSPDSLVEIIGRDMHLVRVKLDIVVLLVVLIQQGEELDGDAPASVFTNCGLLVVQVRQLVVNASEQGAGHRGNRLPADRLPRVADRPVYQCRPCTESLLLLHIPVAFRAQSYGFYPTFVPLFRKSTITHRFFFTRSAKKVVPLQPKRKTTKRNEED